LWEYRCHRNRISESVSFELVKTPKTEVEREGSVVVYYMMGGDNLMVIAEGDRRWVSVRMIGT